MSENVLLTQRFVAREPLLLVLQLLDHFLSDHLNQPVLIDTGAACGGLEHWCGGHHRSLNPLQQAFIDQHALQCGFCTPGFLMLITAALEAHPAMSDEDIVEVVSSNLCRCTGYVNIIKAVKQVRDSQAGSQRCG